MTIIVTYGLLECCAGLPGKRPSRLAVLVCCMVGSSRKASKGPFHPLFSTCWDPGKTLYLLFIPISFSFICLFIRQMFVASCYVYCLRVSV